MFMIHLIMLQNWTEWSLERDLLVTQYKDESSEGAIEPKVWSVLSFQNGHLNCETFRVLRASS